MVLAKTQQKFDEMSERTGQNNPQTQDVAKIRNKPRNSWAGSGLLEGDQLVEIADWVFDTLVSGEVFDSNSNI